MPKKVRIPTPLRKLTNNEELVEINAATIGEAIVELQTRFPGIQERLVDEKGEVRRFVNVYVNEEDIRFLKTARRRSRTATKSASSPPSPAARIYHAKKKTSATKWPNSPTNSTPSNALWLMYPPKLIKKPFIWEVGQNSRSSPTSARPA
jgi:sulfur-carrier protein